MKIFTTRAQVSEYVATQRKTGQSIGFVPTMGALHQGHISIIDLARQHTDTVICSIFVNPTQFNDLKDLERYPRPVENDIEKLEKAHCDALFMPDVSEMYAPNEDWHIDLDGLDTVLEGKLRPGHYQGVTQIVKKLLDTVQPDLAFFGQKDYQQFLVIAKLIEKLNMNTKLFMCPIIRDEDGLAMSSRNIHLSVDERKNALALSRTLFWIQSNYQTKTIAELEAEARNQLLHSPGIELEYLALVDENLQPITSKSPNKTVALLAARVGKTRLIDNTILN